MCPLSMMLIHAWRGALFTHPSTKATLLGNGEGVTRKPCRLRNVCGREQGHNCCHLPVGGGTIRVSVSEHRAIVYPHFLPDPSFFTLHHCSGHLLLLATWDSCRCGGPGCRPESPRWRQSCAHREGGRVRRYY